MSWPMVEVLWRWGLLLLAVSAVSVRAADRLPDFTELAEQNAPAVVNISTVYHRKAPRHHGMLPENAPESEQGEGPLGELLRRYLEEREQEQQQEMDSLGSGFIISSDGYIVTNHHVVDGADEIIVHLHNRDTYRAKLVGSDEASDIALIKVEAKGLPTVKIGDSSKLKIGAWVLAIGSPFGFDYTVTAGIVSAKGRSLPSENYVPYIQTDVAINPGNSGGPLFNMDGEVVGVNSQIFSQSGGFMGLSFAVPINLAMNVARQLKEKGRVIRGFLGVLIQDLDQDLARAFGLDHPRGALISKVLPDSPASKAGLQVGDVILAYNGQPVHTSGELPPLVGTTAVGTEVPLVVQRKGHELVLRVRVEALPERPAEKEIPPRPQAEQSHADRLGLVVEEISAKQREELGLAPGEGGVLVRRVQKGPARKAGIRPGDLLLRLGDEPVRDKAHYQKLLQRLPSGREVAVLVQRREGPAFLALRLPD